MSAVDKAREVIEHIHTEVTSNPRLGIVQLFGSVSGFVVSHAVLAGSAPRCYLALVPEVPFSLDKIANYLKRRLEATRPAPSGLIVMAEAALPSDALEVINAVALAGLLLTDAEKFAVDEFMMLQREHKAFSGQTSDELRSACLKIVSNGLKYYLKQISSPDSPLQQLRVLTNEPRHIIRAIPPSAHDIIMGRRLGNLAVDNAMAGFTDFMISQWLTEFVLVPLPLVVLGRKQIHQEGIFWKSVLAKTGSWDCFNLDGKDDNSRAHNHDLNELTGVEDRARRIGSESGQQLAAPPPAVAASTPLTVAPKSASSSARSGIFVSYSHLDGKWLHSLKTMLSPLIRDGSLKLWDDTLIKTGAVWKEEIEKALASTKVAVLLVSANFLASDFIAKNELPPLLATARDEGLKICWVYISSAPYERTEIAKYQAAHDVKRPLDRMPRDERQAALSKVAFEIEQLAH